MIFIVYLKSSLVLKNLMCCTAICQNVTKKYMPFLKVRPQFKPTMTSRGFFKPDFFPCILNRILSIHRKRDNLLWGTTEHFVRIRCLVSYFVTSHTHEIEHEQAKEQHGNGLSHRPAFEWPTKEKKRLLLCLKEFLENVPQWIKGRYIILVLHIGMYG